MIKAAIMGYGTIGSGVFHVINENRALIAEKAGDEISVKYVLDLRDRPGDPAESLTIKDVNIILEDPEVSIVVETMGGINPAFDFVMRALKAGKSVCTSNKELVARHGAKLLETARDNQVNFLFEASVGGGIPIIRPLNSSLTADEIDEITGILNGTTNYILTKMCQEGHAFEEVLEKAQEKGFAEKNPTADVEGFDACRKIAILTSMITGKRIDSEDIYTEGITNITTNDFKYADVLGMSIKLLATSKRTKDSYCAYVAPAMIDSSNALYAVSGVFNGILLRGDIYNDLMFYGKGAGKLPTASAVVADIVDAAKNPGKTILYGWSDEKLELADHMDSCKRFFVRLKGDADADLAKAEDILGKVELVKAPGVEGEFGLVTQVMSEAHFMSKSEELSNMLQRIRLM